MGSGKPYTDLKVTPQCIVREFDQEIDPVELLWHRDDEDRVVEVLECGEGWKFQYDNDLPVKIWGEFKLWIEEHID